MNADIQTNTLVSFTHTTHKTEVVIFAEMIVGVFYFEGYKSTCLIPVGGSPIPVTETVQEAIEKLKTARAIMPAAIKEA